MNAIDELGQLQTDELLRRMDQIIARITEVKAVNGELLAALIVIASFKGRTLLSMTSQRYDEGANAAFEQCAAIAIEAIARTEKL